METESTEERGKNLFSAPQSLTGWKNNLQIDHVHLEQLGYFRPPSLC